MNKIITLAFASMFLVACGGGGGGGGSSAGASNTTRFQETANTTPIDGSVIQYVGAKDITDIGIVAESSGKITFNNVISGLSTAVLNPTDNVSEVSESGGGITVTFREYEKALANNQTLAAEILTFNISSEHLSAGAWIENYSTNSTIGDVGIFVDGGEKTTQAVVLGATGSKTYTGIALGYYQDNIDVKDGVAWYSTAVTVEVDFGTATETGTITSVSITDPETDDPNIVVGSGSRVDLQSAAITDVLGGFTTGNTTASADDGSRYSGKWGSQFYYIEGTQPKYIAGTFGGAGTNAASDYGTFIGVFLAK